MNKNEKTVVFGDSIAHGVVPYLAKRLEQKFSREDGYESQVIDRGVPSETTRDGLQRLNDVLADKATSAVLVFGMNDWRKGVSLEEFEKNYSKLVEALVTNHEHCVVCTITPDHNGPTFRFSQPGRQGPSPEIPQYNEVIKEVARRYKVKIANTHPYWERTFKSSYLGLEDAIHPNSSGYETMVDAIFPVLTRRHLLVLWQFNGRYAHCNYSCQYCYVPTSVNKGTHFRHTVEKWETALNRHFGDRKASFYFSYGEPMAAGRFYDVMEMLGNNPNWDARMTSNLSLKLDRLLKTRLVKEGRFNVNGSFHPTETSIDAFIKKLDTLRSAGIEPSVVYVMHPPIIDAFEKEYMPRFREKGYVVHIRAYRGLAGGRKYPGAYTRDQWAKVAKYMDTANLKYQLNEINGLGRLTLIGMNHILVDNEGKIEMCDSYVGDRSYGNVFDDEIHLDLEPKPFPGLVPLAAVDDIADYTELGYTDLLGNNVLAYARQGGVYKKENGEIVYPHEHLDLHDDAVRAKISEVADPFVPPSSFWLDAKWFAVHFGYSFVLKKYGKFVYAWAGGKYRLWKKGKLKLENFWHS